jgi:hypothetical protein
MLRWRALSPPASTWRAAINEPSTTNQRCLRQIGIPLLSDDGPGALELQQGFQRTYDAGPYRREIDSRQGVPAPLLNQEHAAWAAQSIARINSADSR